MPDDPSPPDDSNLERLPARLFLAVEHALYVVLGALLAIAAAIALGEAGAALVHAIGVWGDPVGILDVIDRLLFVLMLAEILHTVRVSIRSGEIQAEPFLIVGLIASIRRVLVITLRSSEATNDTHWTPDMLAMFRSSMIELGVLALMILVMVASIMMLRRGRLPGGMAAWAPGSPRRTGKTGS